MAGRYQAYPEYKDSGLEWLGGIPTHWFRAKFKFLARQGKVFASGPFGSSIGSQFYRGKGVPVIRGNNLSLNGNKPKYIDGGYVFLDEDKASDLSNAEVLPGDLVFTARGTVGQIGLVPNDGAITWDRAILSANQLRYRNKSLEMSSQFLWYLFSSWLVRTQILLSSDSVAQPNLNLGSLKNLHLLSPKYDEQEKIANFLDHETAKIDTLIEKQQQLIKLLKEKRQAVISHAVTKGLNPNSPMRDSDVEWLGEVPEHWVVARLKYQVEMLPGYAFKSAGFTDSSEEINLLRGVNITPGKVRWNDTVYWPRHNNDDLAEYVLREKDLVLGMDRPWVAEGLRLAMLSAEDLPAYVVQRVARIRGVHGVSQEFLFGLLSAPSFSSYFDPITTGVSVPHISTDQIGEYCFALPPKSERQEIVEFIGLNASKYKNLVGRAERAIKLMQERRTALISAAVTGKIDVRNWQAPESPTNKEVAA